MDLALLDWATRKVRRLTTEKDPTRNWSPVAFSADGRTLFANRGFVDGSDSDVYRLDLATSRAENLTPHEGRVAYSANALFQDGKTLLVQSTARSGYQNVALLDVATKKLTWVTDTHWEAWAGDASPDGKSFTYLVNEDGRTDVYLAGRATLEADKLALEPGLNYFTGTPSGFSPTGDRLLLSHESSRTPADLWVYDVASRRSKQLTVSTVASLDPRAIPPSQIVHYASSDGKVISAFLWVPFNLERDGTAPAIVLPHGGPTGQVVDYWNTDAAALASRGYVCIAPNVRGSTGYGLEFQRANYQDLGGMDLQDEVKAADFLIGTGYVDPKRIGIFGGSYGGFMTLMALGKTPERWAAGVELYGIINWFTMLKHSDPLLNQYLRSLLGDPEKDRQAYENASPIKYVHDLRAPLLVLHGDNDIRVPKEEAEQVVDLLKKGGRVVEAHYYTNEGHGFLKRENQIDSIRRTIEWFDRHLKPGDAGSPR
jgi:dipeptidyl aminopeptidase/acylaminoacyl peptidase